MTVRSTLPAGTAGRLPGLELRRRPSGIELAIAELPAEQAPFTLARVVVPVGGSTAPDRHDVREVWLIERGEGTLTLDGVTTRARPGDAFFFQSQQVHEIVNESTAPLEITSVWWRP